MITCTIASRNFNPERGLRGTVAAGLLLVGIAWGPSALAAETDSGGAGWYLQGDLGYAQPKSGDGTERDPGNGTPLDPPSLTRFPVKFDGSPVIGGAIGYLIDQARVEIELKYLQNKIKEPAASSLGSDDIKALMASLNVWYASGPFWGIEPYVGGGLGGIQRKLTGASDTDVAGQLGLGADWRLADHWTLTTGYRYIDNASMKFKRGDHDMSTTYKVQTLSAGLRYVFFTEEKAPAPAPIAVVKTAPIPDTDDDGVYDRQDKCPGTPPATFVDETGCPPPAPVDTCKTPEPGERVSLAGCATGDKIVLPGVHFEFNKSRLTADASGILDEVAAELKKYTGFEVEIGGHTDNKGSDSYNQQLSDSRAQSVKDYLIANGVSRSRIVTVGYGESEPVSDNDTDDGRAQNRRVELKILGGAAVEAPKPTSTASEPALSSSPERDEAKPDPGPSEEPSQESSDDLDFLNE